MMLGLRTVSTKSAWEVPPAVHLDDEEPPCGQADTFMDEVEFALPNTPERELFLQQELLGRMGEIEARAKECNAAVKAANTVSEREALPGQEEHIARIQQALNENDVCVRSALGQSFSKWLKENPDQAQAYANLKAPTKTVQMKKDSRLRWAKREQEEKSMLKKSKLEAYQVVEGEEGTYEPLEMVVQHEGGRHSAQAWEVALNYLQRCMELGGMWISYNDFTKRVEVLYIKRTRRSSFDQKWQLYEEGVLTSWQPLPATDTMAAALAAPEEKRAADAAAPSDITPTKRPKHQAATTPTPKAAPHDKGGSGRQVTGQDKENQKLLRASQVMKSLYLKINTEQNSILASMLDPGDSAWMSLSSKGNIDSIKQLMLSIDSLLKDEFAAAFIRTDLGDLKKEYNTKEPGKQMTDFWFKLRSLHGPLSEAVKQLDLEQQRLLRMYRAGKH